jgi:hypothetical protein
LYGDVCDPVAMNPFDAISSVGTPLALAAFVVAVVAWVYRARLAERRKLIETAPEDKRAELLESAIRDFSTVPVENLTKDQRYQLAVRLIQERASRFRIAAAVSVVVALLLAAVILLNPSAGEPVTDLAVRLQGPDGPLETGTVTLDAGKRRERREVGADGIARFPDVAAAAYAAGLTLTASAPGYRQAAPTELAAPPPGGAAVVTLVADSARVRGTVLDDPTHRQPLAGVVLDFGGGLAADTTDALGHFAVVLPAPPGGRIPVRLRHDDRTGFDDAVTLTPGEGLVLYFELGTPP